LTTLDNDDGGLSLHAARAHVRRTTGPTPSHRCPKELIQVDAVQRVRLVPHPGLLEVPGQGLRAVAQPPWRPVSMRSLPACLAAVPKPRRRLCPLQRGGRSGSSSVEAVRPARAAARRRPFEQPRRACAVTSGSRALVQPASGSGCRSPTCPQNRLVARCATLGHSVGTWKSGLSLLGCSTELQSTGGEEHEAGGTSGGGPSGTPSRRSAGRPDQSASLW
jgi:hypothetical protein